MMKKINLRKTPEEALKEMRDEAFRVMGIDIFKKQKRKTELLDDKKGK